MPDMKQPMSLSKFYPKEATRPTASSYPKPAVQSGSPNPAPEMMPVDTIKGKIGKYCLTPFYPK